MSKSGEIAEIGKTFSGLNRRKRVVLGHISDCHTHRMGGNTLVCECGHKETHYNSCRDRYCPLCQGASRAQVHCILPGGGLSPDKSHWIEGNSKYLVPVKTLSVVFQGKLLSSLRTYCDKGGALFGDPVLYEKHLRSAARKNFVVYAEKPFGNPA